MGVWSILCMVPLLNGARLAWWFGLNQYLFDWGYFMGIDWVFKGGRCGERSNSHPTPLHSTPLHSTPLHSTPNPSHPTLPALSTAAFSSSSAAFLA